MNDTHEARRSPSPAVKVLAPEGSELMQVTALTCSGGRLTFKGKAFGAMPMSGVLRPAELRAVLRLLGVKGIFQVLLLLLLRR